MRRQSQEEVAAAARRRLELLGRELDQAGLRRVDDPGDRASDVSRDAAASLPEPSTVAPAGRHARVSRPAGTRRLGSWVGGQVPDTLRGRVGLEPGPVLLVVALVALAVAATAYVVLRTGGDSEAVPSPPTLANPAHESPLVPSPAATGASPGTGEDVTVDVAGKVRRPGRHDAPGRLPGGRRVEEGWRSAWTGRPERPQPGADPGRRRADPRRPARRRRWPAAWQPARAQRHPTRPGRWSTSTRRPPSSSTPCPASDR